MEIPLVIDVNDPNNTICGDYCRLKCVKKSKKKQAIA